MSESTVIATRPTPGHPRPYEFPAFRRTLLDNGLQVIVAQMAGRPLITSSLVIRNGAADARRRDPGDGRGPGSPAAPVLRLSGAGHG